MWGANKSINDKSNAAPIGDPRGALNAKEKGSASCGVCGGGCASHLGANTPFPIVARQPVSNTSPSAFFRGPSVEVPRVYPALYQNPSRRSPTAGNARAVLSSWRGTRSTAIVFRRRGFRSLFRHPNNLTPFPSRDPLKPDTMSDLVPAVPRKARTGTHDDIACKSTTHRGATAGGPGPAFHFRKHKRKKKAADVWLGARNPRE